VKLERPVTAVIFDLDGILLDSEPLYTVATQRLVGQFGKTYTWAHKSRMMGRSAAEGARYLIGALELPMTEPEYLQARRVLLEEVMPLVEPLPGAPQFVGALAGRGIPMAVATSSERFLTELKIVRHSWFSSFRAIICGTDPEVARVKPAPDIFLEAARRLNKHPRDCLVFEDSPAGVQAALEAEMQVVAIADPQLERTMVQGAHIVVGGYAEVAWEDLGL
jgi:pseudouridine-5'-monophosphatase